ncbi:hypothetical protein LTR91_004947 [Friedmanniomyces endolithicus]|nr:hypothetical protein LTS09_012397 [Friedmanniomyces endolithicus]KAK0307660.1 hypothetical protein LTR01_005660 [Friedmanniomyces endolithicus]KAK0323126.1 hypothetical protein LTR82_006057 [Friedmanniomyces endolithicus]KAK0825647.1 hypothetical protein LTR73_006801 [Friedmanniomyces endolithicus]KAK0922273.1 hypothetical protein LTR57_007961 [Friedmanniomyces endolithicus]
MRGLFKIATAASALLATALAAPITKVRPGNGTDIIITSQNTVNATEPAPANATRPAPANATVASSTFKIAEDIAVSNGRLPLALVNNFAGAINAYVTGLDSNNQLVMLQPDGTWLYPVCDPSISTPQPVNANVAIPLGGQGSTTQVTLPGYISAARVWFAAGSLEFFTVYSSASNGPSLVEPSAVNPSDPSAAVSWGFVELTNTADGGLYANISYVDFVGLVLGMSLLSGDGSVQAAHGLQATAVASICSLLEAQSARDGMPWTDLCQVDASGKPLRIIAPSDHVASNPDAFSDYFTDHTNEVWTYYSTNTLTIDTQAAAGKVACTVQGDQLTCAGDNRGYARPLAGDIFGCNSGPFAIEAGDNDVHRAIVPRLCAAFDRTTLLMTGGDSQPGLPSTSYYQSAPTNWYSAFIHQTEVDGKGYAFSYDDVNPDGDVNQSGVVADGDPRVLTVIVGGPLSG